MVSEGATLELDEYSDCSLCALWGSRAKCRSTPFDPILEVGLNFLYSGMGAKRLCEDGKLKASDEPSSGFGIVQLLLTFVRSEECIGVPRGSAGGAQKRQVWDRLAVNARDSAWGATTIEGAILI